MKKRFATIREVRAAREMLNKKISELIEKKFGDSPSYEEDRLWQEDHPSPRNRYKNKIAATNESLRKRADELIFKADMKQISADELFEAVVNLK